jgi:hypothetical protein
MEIKYNPQYVYMKQAGRLFLNKSENKWVQLNSGEVFGRSSASRKSLVKKMRKITRFLCTQCLSIEKHSKCD